MQDADKQRPYYGRGLVLFAQGSRTSDANPACLDGWMGVGTRPRPATRPARKIDVDVRVKFHHAPNPRP
ncbi:MAG TPA: hypothetical protein VKX46_04160 [Ktedonobacteraceae bacterium]|nr:hypothetical protein [Ktedonobacteraceae bacterium]